MMKSIKGLGFPCYSIMSFWCDGEWVVGEGSCGNHVFIGGHKMIDDLPYTLLRLQHISMYIISLDSPRSIVK